MSEDTVTIPKSLWVRLLHSVALADHVGEAADDLRQFAELCGLPAPGESAELDVAPEDQTAENSWIGWAKSLGIEDGIWSDQADQERQARKHAGRRSSGEKATGFKMALHVGTVRHNCPMCGETWNRDALVALLRRSTYSLNDEADVDRAIEALAARPAAPPVVHPSEIPHDIRATVHSSQSDARGADSPAANAGVRSVESCGRGDDRDRATVAAPPVGEAERQAAMLDADAALMEKEAPGSWAVAPPPADLVALVRRVMNAYTRELEARNAWVISAPQSRESFELFEVVQAREADTRAAFLALHAYPLPEVPDGK